MTEAYQKTFRHLFDGTVEEYDPWDASYRTAGTQYPGTTMCSAFRTFQGWTALSDMDHDQGVLHTVPIPEAMGYLMLRPLLPDVPDEDMTGVALNQVFPVSRSWHSLLLQAASGIPDVKAGGLRLVALRHDPQRGAGDRPEGLGQRHVHPGRAVVSRATRPTRRPSGRHSFRARAQPTSPPRTMNKAG